MGNFEVRGYAEKTLNYDIAVINITFVERSESASTASKRVMKQCEVFLRKMDEIGIKPSDFTVTTDDVSAPRYDDENRYCARRSLRMRTSYDMKSINMIRSITDAMECDAEFSLDYELSNENELHEELRKAAILDSKRKAEEIAATLGLAVKKAKKMGDRSNMDEYGDRLCCCVGDILGLDDFTMSNELGAKETTESETVYITWDVG
jgi:uncharacterized protein YggE